MTTERDRVLDRVAGFLEPAPDALSAVHRRIERRERTRRLGGGVVGVALIVALIAIGMRAADNDDVPADQPPVEIASSDDGRPWSLFVVQTSDGAGITVGGPYPSMPISVDVPADLAPDGVAFTDQRAEGSGFIVGVVGAGVATLTEIEGGHQVDVPLYDVPFDRADLAAAFIVPLDGWSPGWLVARDDHGEVIQTFRFAPGVTCGATTSCAAEDAVLVDAADDGTTYQVVLRGSGTLVLIDDLGVEHGHVSGPTSVPVEVTRTDVTNRGMPVVLGVASAELTEVQMIGPFDGDNFDEVVDAPTATLPDGRLVFLAYQYAGYFVPHTFLVSDAACSRSVALNYPSLEAVATPEIGVCK